MKKSKTRINGKEHEAIVKLFCDSVDGEEPVLLDETGDCYVTIQVNGRPVDIKKFIDNFTIATKEEGKNILRKKHKAFLHLKNIDTFMNRVRRQNLSEEEIELRIKTMPEWMLHNIVDRLKRNVTIGNHRVQNALGYIGIKNDADRELMENYIMEQIKVLYTYEPPVEYCTECEKFLICHQILDKEACDGIVKKEREERKPMKAKAKRDVKVLMEDDRFSDFRKGNMYLCMERVDGFVLMDEQRCGFICSKEEFAENFELIEEE